ncbi:STAS domain-containing protein [Candidatus Auribacterota bacterium]
MKIDIKREEDNAVMLFEGNFVAATLEGIKNSLKQLISEDVTAITMDFEKVDFIDSMGIGTLAACYNTLKNKGGGLTIINVNQNIKRLFSLMRLDSHFTIKEKE